MYNPYRRQPFTMTCFDLNTLTVKKKLQEFERHQRSEDQSSTLHKELTELKQSYQQDLSQHSNQLNKALQIIERQQNAINEIKNNKNLLKTDEESFNKSVSRNKEMNEKNNRLENVAELDDIAGGEAQDVNSFENDVVATQGNSPLSTGSHRHQNQHQRTGRKISFAPANSLYRHKSKKVILNKHEDSSDEDHEEYDDNKETENYSNKDQYDYDESEDEIDGHDYDEEEVDKNKRHRKRSKTNKERILYEEDEQSSDFEDSTDCQCENNHYNRYKSKHKSIPNTHKIMFR